MVAAAVNDAAAVGADATPGAVVIVADAGAHFEDDGVNYETVAAVVACAENDEGEKAG